jgi:hypothetical protein
MSSKLRMAGMKKRRRENPGGGSKVIKRDGSNGQNIVLVSEFELRSGMKPALVAPTGKQCTQRRPV